MIKGRWLVMMNFDKKALNLMSSIIQDSVLLIRVLILSVSGIRMKTIVIIPIIGRYFNLFSIISFDAMVVI